MADETNTPDDARPLSPEERKALRELIIRKDDIIDVASNFSHLGWFATAILKVAKWTAAVVGGIVAFQMWKSGGLGK